MDFDEFLELENHPLRKGKKAKPPLLLSALKAYLNSRDLLPYYMAIQRRGSGALQADICQKFTKLSELFAKVLDQHRDGLEQIQKWSEIWDKLVSKAIPHHSLYEHAVYESALRRLLFLCGTEIRVFIGEVKAKGTNILSDELRNGLRRATAFDLNKRFLSFDEFVWECCFHQHEADFEKFDEKYCRLTLQQLFSYLEYLKYFINPYLQVRPNSENNKQAHKLSKVIETIISQYTKLLDENDTLLENIRRYQLEVSDYTDKIKTHEVAIKKIEQQIALTKYPPLRQESPTRQMWEIRRTISLDPSIPKLARHSYPNSAKMCQLETNVDRLRTTIHKSRQQLFKNTFFMALSDGSVNREHPIYKKLQECTNYWETEIIRIQSRSTDIQTLYQCNFLVTPHAEETLYRIIYEGQKELLMQSRIFMQHPLSQERASWFAEQGAAPGSDIAQRPFTCEIKLKANVLALLNMLQKPVDGAAAQPKNQYGVVIVKEAEPHCFGIHEDALEVFSFLVESVTIRGNKPYNSSYQYQLRTVSNQSIIRFYQNPVFQLKEPLHNLRIGIHLEPHYLQTI